jgi:hypothetical protein
MKAGKIRPIELGPTLFLFLYLVFFKSTCSDKKLQFYSLKRQYMVEKAEFNSDSPVQNAEFPFLGLS